MCPVGFDATGAYGVNEKWKDGRQEGRRDRSEGKRNGEEGRGNGEESQGREGRPYRSQAAPAPAGGVRGPARRAAGRAGERPEAQRTAGADRGAARRHHHLWPPAGEGGQETRLG